MNRHIALLLLPCALSCGCRGSLTRHGPVDPDLAAYIPPDTVALVGIRMDRLRATPLYHTLAARNRLPHLGEFREEDIQNVLLASDAKNVLVIARGSFPAKSTAITLADDHTALAGSPATVQAAIRQAKNGGHSPPRDLMARTEMVPAGGQVWAVVVNWPGIDPETLRWMGNLANMDRILRSVQSATLSIDLSAGAHAAFTGDCQTEAGAGSLSDSLRGLASLARIGLARNKPDLVRVFDGIQVRQNGRVVTVNIDIPQELADKLAAGI